jgi:RNA polymerase sigma factor (sigma-70 family)
MRLTTWRSGCSARSRKPTTSFRKLICGRSNSLTAPLCGRAWLLRIVRNVAYTRLRKQRKGEPETSFDETIHSLDGDATDPEYVLLRRNDLQLLKKCLDALPVEFREVLVLRELEGLSYKEIAEVSEIPLGTVMSRLARARERLRDLLCECQHRGTKK